MLNRLRKTRPERSIRTRLLVTTALVGAIAATALLPAASAETGGAAAEARMAGSGVPKLPGYELTWKDDFNGAAGKPVEPGKWIYDTGTGYGCAGCPSNWGTFEIESMTDSPQNVSFDGQGNLLITPVKQADGTWTSGQLRPATGRHSGCSATAFAATTSTGRASARSTSWRTSTAGRRLFRPCTAVWRPAARATSSAASARPSTTRPCRIPFTRTRWSSTRASSRTSFASTWTA